MSRSHRGHSRHQPVSRCRLSSAAWKQKVATNGDHGPGGRNQRCGWVYCAVRLHSCQERGQDAGSLQNLSSTCARTQNRTCCQFMRPRTLAAAAACCGNLLLSACCQLIGWFCAARTVYATRRAPRLPELLPVSCVCSLPPRLPLLQRNS